MRYSVMIAAATLALAAPAYAANPIEGTWKADVKSVRFEEKPNVTVLQGGVYKCESGCTKPWSTRADGKFHAVSGHNYFDAASVTITDPKTVKLALRKGGKDTNVTVMTVSADGKTMTYVSTDMTGSKPVEYKSTAARAAAGPKGSHAVSGTWKSAKAESASDDAITLMVAMKGDVMEVSSPTGYGFSAKLGGPPVPIRTDVAGTMAAMKKTGPNNWVETDTRKGNVVGTLTWTLAPDGKTIKAVSQDKERDARTIYTLVKQ